MRDVGRSGSVGSVNGAGWWDGTYAASSISFGEDRRAADAFNRGGSKWCKLSVAVQPASVAGLGIGIQRPFEHWQILAGLEEERAERRRIKEAPLPQVERIPVIATPPKL